MEVKMNMHIKTAACLAAIATCMMSSCIREELDPCPLLKLNVVVKDKNYFNVSKTDLEESRSETLAFSEYVPNLYYRLTDVKTGAVVAERQLSAVQGDAKSVGVEFPESLPFGTYVLTAWGGLDDMTPLSADRTSMTTHPDNAEGSDAYVVSDTLRYDINHYDYTVSMERTKGKLIVLAENLPEGYDATDMTVNSLFATAASNLTYTGSTFVSKQAALSAAPMVTKTLLAPSTKVEASLFDLKFTDTQTGGKALTPEKVKITMRRNELTVLRYVWQPAKHDFLIYMLVNDNWEQVHGMIID